MQAGARYGAVEAPPVGCWRPRTGFSGGTGIIDDACGVRRLPNGNTVIASDHTSEGVKLFEVDGQKRVVWSYSGPHRVHHFQLLTTNGEPIPSTP